MVSTSQNVTTFVTDNVIRLFPQQDHVMHEPNPDRGGTSKHTVSNKQKGKSSEVFAFEIEDIGKMLHLYAEREQWIHYLLFAVACNTARRVGDVLSLRWINFYDPRTGSFRENIMGLEEEKTGKIASPRINFACRKAIELYIEKTGCDPSANGYMEPVFMQLSGTHKGNVLSYSGCIKRIKKTAEELGIKYNVGTHSMRKTFGAVSVEIHPSDPTRMQVLQGVYKHSSEAMSAKYIGLTKQKENGYYEDFGNEFQRSVDGEHITRIGDKAIVSLDASDLRSIIAIAYEMGMQNANSHDVVTPMKALNDILEMVEEIAK